MISKSGSRAFTLVELLVVISIVALLASFALPGLSRAKEYAYFTRCKSNLRQIGVGFLLYAGNCDGKLPEGDKRCTTGHQQGTGVRYERKIGSFGAVWCGKHAGTEWGKNLLEKIYDRQRRQDLPGTYLPVEILWDPIVKVRDWNYGYHANSPLGSAGTEEERDMMCRDWGKFGYEFFVFSAGCASYQADPGKSCHVLSGRGGTSTNARDTEEPWRWATKGRTITTSAKPSAWLGACCIPSTWALNAPRNYRSHFGARTSRPGRFVFNVVHLDGHVHNGTWKEVRSPNSTHWLIFRSGYYNPMYSTAYGWLWDCEPTKPSSSAHMGSRNEPDFAGAFDENK
jgi:prepilin-type N-terminal cleavage/methylation domain-containing protein